MSQPTENKGDEMSDDIESRTEPIRLESGMIITSDWQGWKIRAGGAQQPDWRAQGETLEECIADLVEQITKDAIEDEAREWREETK